MAFNINAQLILNAPKNIKKVRSTIQKELGGVDVGINLTINKNTSRNVNVLNKELKSLNSTLSSIDAVSQRVSQSLNNINAVNQKLNVTQAKVSKATQNVNKDLSETAKQAASAGSEIESFGKDAALAIRRFSAFTIATTAVFGFIRAVQQGVNQAIEFERELARIVQVTGATDRELRGLKGTVDDLATSLGLDANRLLEVSRIFSQTGQSIDQVRKSITAVARASLAPTFGDIERTAEGVIAALNQFDIQAGRTEAVLGSLNAVSKKFAVESDDLISVIRRAGGVFAASTSQLGKPEERLTELISIFTAVRSTTRETADTIATGLRTIFTRIQRPQTIEFLKQFGVELRATAEDAKRLGIVEGEFVGIFEAFRRLSGEIGNLDTLSLAKVVEELGGIRQVGKLLPALRQFDKAERARQVALAGTESITQDVAIATETLAVKIEKVQQRFNKLIREVTQSDTFQTLAKFAVGAANGFLLFAESLKPILPLLTALAGIKLTSAAFDFTKGFIGGIRKNNGAQGVGGGLASAITGGNEVAKETAKKELQAASSANTRALQANSEKLTSLNSSITTLKTSATTLTTQSKDLSGKIVNLISAITRLSTTLPTVGSSALASTQALKPRKRRAKGGTIPKFARGGYVRGPSHADGGVVAELEGGEYVVPKKQVQKFSQGGTVAIKPGTVGGFFLDSGGKKNLDINFQQTSIKNDKEVIATLAKGTVVGFQPQSTIEDLKTEPDLVNIAQESALAGITTSLQKAAPDFSKALDTSVINTNDAKITNAVKSLTKGDDNVVNTVGGYIFEGLIQAISGATLQGGREAFDFKNFTKSDKEKLGRMFKNDAGIESLIVADAKFSANQGKEIKSKIARSYKDHITKGGPFPPFLDLVKKGTGASTGKTKTAKGGRGTKSSGQNTAKFLSFLKNGPSSGSSDRISDNLVRSSNLSEEIRSSLKTLKGDQRTYTNLRGLLKNQKIDINSLASGGSVGLSNVAISDGELVVPPKDANRYLGKLKRANEGKSEAGLLDKLSGAYVASGPGTGTSDSIKTSLPSGSFVVNAKDTGRLLNEERLAKGGSVGRAKLAKGGKPPSPTDSLEGVAQTVLTLSILSSLDFSSLEGLANAALVLGLQFREFFQSTKDVASAQAELANAANNAAEQLDSVQGRSGESSFGNTPGRTNRSSRGGPNTTSQSRRNSFEQRRAGIFNRNIRNFESRGRSGNQGYRAGIFDRVVAGSEREFEINTSKQQQAQRANQAAFSERRRNNRFNLGVAETRVAGGGSDNINPDLLERLRARQNSFGGKVRKTIPTFTKAGNFAGKQSFKAAQNLGLDKLAGGFKGLLPSLGKLKGVLSGPGGLIVALTLGPAINKLKDSVLGASDEIAGVSGNKGTSAAAASAFGAASGAVTGGAAGAIAGPIGIAVGAIGGAIAGGINAYLQQARFTELEKLASAGEKASKALDQLAGSGFNIAGNIKTANSSVGNVNASLTTQIANTQASADARNSFANVTSKEAIGTALIPVIGPAIIGIAQLFRKDATKESLQDIEAVKARDPEIFNKAAVANARAGSSLVAATSGPDLDIIQNVKTFDQLTAALKNSAGSSELLKDQLELLKKTQSLTNFGAASDFSKSLSGFSSEAQKIGSDAAIKFATEFEKTGSTQDAAIAATNSFNKALSESGLGSEEANRLTQNFRPFVDQLQKGNTEAIAAEAAQKKMADAIAAQTKKIDAFTAALDQLGNGVTNAISDFDVASANIQKNLASALGGSNVIQGRERVNVFANGGAGRSISELNAGVDTVRKELGGDTKAFADIGSTISLSQTLPQAIKASLENIKPGSEVSEVAFRKDIISNIPNFNELADVVKSDLENNINALFAGGRQGEAGGGNLLGADKFEAAIQTGSLDKLSELSLKTAERFAELQAATDKFKNQVIETSSALQGQIVEARQGANISKSERNISFDQRFAQFRGGKPQSASAVLDERIRALTAVGGVAGSTASSLIGDRTTLQKNIAEKESQVFSEATGSSKQEKLIKELSDLKTSLSGNTKALDLLSNDTTRLAEIEAKLTDISSKRLSAQQAAQSVAERLSQAKTPEERRAVFEDLAKPLTALRKFQGTTKGSFGDAANLLADLQKGEASTIRQQSGLPEQQIQQIAAKATAAISAGAAKAGQEVNVDPTKLSDALSILSAGTVASTPEEQQALAKAAEFEQQSQSAIEAQFINTQNSIIKQQEVYRTEIQKTQAKLLEQAVNFAELRGQGATQADFSKLVGDLQSTFDKLAENPFAQKLADAADKLASLPELQVALDTRVGTVDVVLNGAQLIQDFGDKVKGEILKAVSDKIAGLIPNPDGSTSDPDLSNNSARF